MYGDTVTKTTARESIRDARRALRVLEVALKSEGPMREYIVNDDEVIAILSAAVYDTRDAIAGAVK